jgi:phosphoglycolate phosphatase
MPFTFFKKDADKDKKDTKKPADPVQAVVVPPPAPTLVIFDFDGALADSLVHLLDTLNKFSEEKKLGLKLSSYKDVVDILENVKITKMAKLAANYNDLKAAVLNGFAEKVADTKLYQGLRDALLAMREAGYVVGIVCANRAATVHKFLEMHEISSYFHFIKASEGPDKMGLMKAVIQEYKAVKDRTFYVTGRISYVPDVKKIALAVGTCWGGFDQAKEFHTVKAHSVISHPTELLALIGNTATNNPNNQVLQVEKTVSVPVTLPVQAEAVVNEHQETVKQQTEATAKSAADINEKDLSVAPVPRL